MKTNFYRDEFLLLLFANLLFLFPEISLAKGGGGGGGGRGGGGGGMRGGGGGNSGGNSYIFVGGGGSTPFFTNVNGRRICTPACIATFTFLSIFVVGVLICFFCIFYSKYKTKNSHQNYQDTTDNGESGMSYNVNVIRNHDNSLPPSYEFTNPAPDPPHEFGEKHEATKLSLYDARKFSKQHPPNEIPPTPEEIENIIMQDNYKAWKFILEDIVIRAQRAFISDDGRTIQIHKNKKGFKYDDISIQTNYPFFFISDTNSKAIELDIMHYFEITLLSTISYNSTVAIGIATKPYPYFRLPGWNQNSVGHSDDGRKFWNYEFGGRDYGPNWGKLGDVIGCGYKPKTGEIFFTKNGRFLGIAFAGLRHIWYPSIGSDGDVKMKVNFGEEEFVYKGAQGYGIGAPSKRIINKE